MFLTSRTLEALEFAALAHRHQMRKGAPVVPYISHPAMVGSILARAQFSEDAIVAGILHDVIEDTEFSYEDIAEKFGKQVADLVLYVTEDKNLPYVERKQRYLDNLETAPEEALAVSMADSMANLMSVTIYENKYHTLVEGDYKNAVGSLTKYGDLKIAIVSKKMNHPLIETWKQVHTEALAIAKKYNV